MYLFYQCLKYYLHIGHTIKTTNLLASWILYRIKKNIWILNIFKTVKNLKTVLLFLKYIVNFNFPFWFVNLEFTKEFLFKKFSYICGEFACVRNWIRGNLSNFRSIQYSLIKYFLKKVAIKSYIKLYFINNWLLTRYSWPRALFISNLYYNHIVIKEASSIKLPVIGMIDSNIKTYLCNLPIIANDDTVESVSFVLSLISKKILLLKYKKVILWNIRRKLKINNVFYIFYKLSKRRYKLSLSKKYDKVALSNKSIFNILYLNPYLKTNKNFKLINVFYNVLQDYKKGNNDNYFEHLLFNKYKIIRHYKSYLYVIRKNHYYINYIKKPKKLLYKIKYFDFAQYSKNKKWHKFFIFYLYLFIYIFKSIRFFYEVLFEPTIRNLTILKNILKKEKLKSSLYLYKYNRKWIIYNYFLKPIIRKFSIKKKKKGKGLHNFYNPIYYYKRLNTFFNYFKIGNYFIKNFTFKYYLKWFFLSLRKLKNLRYNERRKK